MFKGSKGSNTKVTMSHWVRNIRTQLFYEGILVGLFTGLVVVAYRFLLDEASGLRNGLLETIKGHSQYILLYFMLLLFIGGVISFFMIKEPNISGSGIPQVKGEVLGLFKVNWLKTLVYKFFGGVLGIGAGLSLGREGPSIQLGSSVGEGLSKSFGRLKLEEKYLITSGASAGLAAAFNAPLAGVIFALEEMHKSFSPLVLTCATVASVVADCVCREFFGIKPIFEFNVLKSLPLSYYFYIIVLGVLIGVFGTIFNKVLLKSLNLFDFVKNQYTKIIIPVLIAGVMGLFLPEILGGGHELVNSAGKLIFSWNFLILLIIGKFIFTMISYGSGAPGGIFLPLLVIGALFGNLYGLLVAEIFDVEAVYIENFIILAMAGYFTAIVKAPITGSVLITEMTGSFDHLLSLITISMIAYFVADLLKSNPVYDLLLNRALRKTSNVDKVLHSNKKAIIEVQVEIGSKLEHRKVSEISWPKSCLIVGIKRGEEEIIPKGNVEFLIGDTISILTNDDCQGDYSLYINNIASEDS